LEENNRDIQTIINTYIKKHSELKIIKFWMFNYGINVVLS
jgi:hypothetical protein